MQPSKGLKLLRLKTSSLGALTPKLREILKETTGKNGRGGYIIQEITPELKNIIGSVCESHQV